MMLLVLLLKKKEEEEEETKDSDAGSDDCGDKEVINQKNSETDRERERDRQTDNWMLDSKSCLPHIKSFHDDHHCFKSHLKTKTKKLCIVKNKQNVANLTKVEMNDHKNTHI